MTAASTTSTAMAGALASGSCLSFPDGGGPDATIDDHGSASPGPGFEYVSIVGSARDADDDGRPELVLAHLAPDRDYRLARLRLVVHHSRAVPTRQVPWRELVEAERGRLVAVARVARPGAARPARGGRLRLAITRKGAARRAVGRPAVRSGSVELTIRASAGCL
jgi:hypothetical protein